MSEPPTLVVDAGAFPNLTARIDGPLPTVRCCPMEGMSGWCRCLAWERGRHTLREGDRVWLREAGSPPAAFATATVAKIEPDRTSVWKGHYRRYFVTVTDVEAL